MKTETPAAPVALPAGNLTVRQLGAALAKSASPEPQTEIETEAETETPATEREPSPAETGARVEEEAPDLSQTESEPDGPTEPAGDEATETETETPEQPPKAELPEELRDAMELAKGDGKKGVAELLKRVHKLTEARDTNRNARLAAEERLQQLETEVETLRNTKSEAPANGHSNGHTHPAVAQVSRQIAEVDGFIKLFRSNPDGLELDDGQGGKQALDASAVAEHLDRLRDRRSELVAQRTVTESRVREWYDGTKAEIHQTAVKAYPWLADPKSAEHQRMERLLQQMPGLKQFPDYELVVADYFRGKAAREGTAKVPVKRTVNREPTPVNVNPPSAGAQPKGPKAAAEQRVKELDAQFKKTGKQADLRKLESAKRELQRLGE